LLAKVVQGEAVKKILFALLVTVGATDFATGNTAHAQGDVVTMKENVRPGTIIVRTNERRLYYVTEVGQAISYPVGVGRVGKLMVGHVLYHWQIQPPRLVASSRSAA
jgi:lipoprotein-anchoring transpeptidase ErfK/SrfK